MVLRVGTLALRTSPLLYGGGGRACTSTCNSLASTAAGASSRRVLVLPFGGCPPTSPLRQLRKASTAGDGGGDSGGDHGPSSGDNQQVWAGERHNGAPAGGGEVMLGSPEFVSLVEAQFDVLATALGVHRAVLFVRRENPETGEVGGLFI